jgi:CheY-like chemotaxis protein/signal transduction histidine kinase
VQSRGELAWPLLSECATSAPTRPLREAFPPMMQTAPLPLTSGSAPSLSTQRGDPGSRENAVRVALLATLTVVFAADLLTPAGVAIWIFYIVPLVIGSFSRNPRLPMFVGLVVTVALLLGMAMSAKGLVPMWLVHTNRGFGIAVFWAVAVVTQRLVVARLVSEREELIQDMRVRLLGDLQGASTEGEIGTRLLRRCAEELGVLAGAFYVVEGGRVHREAGLGLAPELARAADLPLGEGMVGEAAVAGGLRIIHDVPADGLRITSPLGSARPAEILIAPARAGEHCHAVIELCAQRPFSDAERILFERSGESIAAAVRAAAHQRRVRELLDETQRQAEELQVQQEELRVQNEELEVQSRTLQESQSRLEQQQSALERAHGDLAERAAVVEEHRNRLLEAQGELVKRTEELERASGYKSEFLANMSHELRTPLNSSLILAKLLAENKHGNLTPDQVRSAETIHAAGSDLLTLINEILDLSRIEAGHVEVLVEDVPVADTVHTLSRFFRPVSEQKQVDFQVAVERDVPPTLPTDAVRQQQVLRNLLSNAFKFTSRGSVRLHVYVADDTHVAFAITDTGEGIPHDKLEVVFEAFRQADGTTQRRHGGTGLGLTISRKLARRLGGDVTVESKVGEGSTFTLLLPRTREPLERAERPRPSAPPPPPRIPLRPAPAPQPAPRAPEPAAPRAPALDDDRLGLGVGERWVLVVEDDLRFAEILRDLAREQHFKCVVASTAHEALATCREHTPSAVILDVHLPDGSGLWVLERIKAEPKTRHVPIHVVSGENYTQQALELGASGYVLKPVDRNRLVDTFRRLEERLDQSVRQVLIVEDNPLQRESLVALLSAENVDIVSAASGDEALALLRDRTFDCMVLDLSLADTSGFELLDAMALGESFSFPPVIVYTGREVTPSEELRLRRYASSIIIKGARSPERLLDEVTLFLHKVEAELPEGAQRMLRGARDRESALAGRRILLAEDDVRNVFALCSFLEPKGVSLRIARNGKEALAAIEESARDPEKSVELVLMDVMMPEMDGLTAMRELRKRPEFAKLPIIALTAKAMPDDRDKCLKAGASDYVSKPLDLDKLTSLIKVWLPK